MRLNSIPKDGGNVVSGAVFLGGTDGKWQSNNIDDALRARNIRSANGIAHIQDFNASLGGPIQRDRLWFFMSLRHMSSDETAADVPKEHILPDGTVYRSVIDQFVRSPALLLTWQMTQQHKLAAWYQRIFERKGREFSKRIDPRAGQPRDAKQAHYGVGQVRWTSTLSSSFLVEGGYSTSYQHPVIGMPDESRRTAWTPEWYASAQREDTALNKNFYLDCMYATGCTRWMSSQWRKIETTRRQYGASASYVTGTHNIKIGFQNWFGPVEDSTERNADLIQSYVNGRPQTVTVYNTPGRTMGHVDNDLGIYVQDSWTIDRLTLNRGSGSSGSTRRCGRRRCRRGGSRRGGPSPSRRACRTGGRTTRRG